MTISFAWTLKGGGEKYRFMVVMVVVVVILLLLVAAIQDDRAEFIISTIACSTISITRKEPMTCSICWILLYVSVCREVD